MPGRTWKLAVQKTQWKKTDPVKIEVNGSELLLVGADSQPLKHEAPQQAIPASPALPVAPVL